MIGERLKELRLKRKYSQQELTDKIGITRSTYSGYENNYAMPDLFTLIKLSKLYNMSLDVIVFGTYDHVYLPDDFVEILIKLDSSDSDLFWTHLIEYAKYLSKK